MCICVCMYVCIYMYICTYVYIYIYIYIHRYNDIFAEHLRRKVGSRGPLIAVAPLPPAGSFLPQLTHSYNDIYIYIYMILMVLFSYNKETASLSLSIYIYIYICSPLRRELPAFPHPGILAARISHRERRPQT